MCYNWCDMGIFKSLFQTKKSKLKEKKFQIGLTPSYGHSESLRALFTWPIQADFFGALEEALILSDTGIQTALSISADLAARLKKLPASDVDGLKQRFIEVMQARYVAAEESPAPFEVIFMMGVNGVGKTTTIGKLAHQFKQSGETVMVIAGDTYRAGAIQQLQIWAERTGVLFYAKAPGSDPSSVIYEGLEKAKTSQVTKVLVDTAGRLQNKQNLMLELDKMVRTLHKAAPSAQHQRWLVLDATTGQNGLSQASVFNEVADLNGIILTKVDGTAKGGIIFAIYDAFQIPIRYIGLGESIDDLAIFDIESYLIGWLGETF